MFYILKPQLTQASWNMVYIGDFPSCAGGHVECDPRIGLGVYNVCNDGTRIHQNDWIIVIQRAQANLLK